MLKTINAFTTLQQTDDYIHVAFSSPKRVISSAVLNGGTVEACHILNKKVLANSSYNEGPNKSLSNYADAQGWQGTVVGMMTAASMDTLCIEHVTVEGVDITALVTTGIDNARRAGDKADVNGLLGTTNKLGTINLILICSASLSDAAMIEAVMVATEAKSAALQDSSVMSPVSQNIATGTGTDSIAIVSGGGSEKIEYCGKHVLLGEWIGRLVSTAITQSLLKYTQ